MGISYFWTNSTFCVEDSEVLEKLAGFSQFFYSVTCVLSCAENCENCGEGGDLERDGGKKGEKV